MSKQYKLVRFYKRQHEPNFDTLQQALAKLESDRLNSKAECYTQLWEMHSENYGEMVGFFEDGAPCDLIPNKTVIAKARVSNIQSALKKVTIPAAKELPDNEQPITFPVTSREPSALNVAVDTEFESRWLPNTGTPPSCEYVIFERRDGSRHMLPYKTADLGWDKIPHSPSNILFYQPAHAPTI